MKLIKEYDSVENLLANTDFLKGALKKKIEENREQIEFSYFLATIRTDVPVEVAVEDLVRKPVDRDKLFAIFDELEFRQLAQRVARRLDAGSNDPSPSLFDDNDFNVTEPESSMPVASQNLLEGDYEILSDGHGLERLAGALAGKDKCGLAILADGENDATSRWIGSAVAVEPGKAFYIPASFDDGKAAVLDLMARADIVKVTAAAKRDYVVAMRERTDNAAALVSFYDISVAHYLVQPEMRHTAEALAHSYLGMEIPPYPGRTSGSRRGGKGTAPVSDEDIYMHACALADAALRLHAPVEADVKKYGMQTLLDDVEFPLVTVLADMELTGVCIDTAALREAETDMNRRIAGLEKEIYELAGEEFNVGSPAKVGEILFERLRLDDKAKKTKTGQYSTGEEILEKLVPRHPIVAMIMRYRAMKKLLNTYLTALPAAINPATGRVHTNYNQTVTATGRISSSSPNLQNIPIRDDEGREIRRAFIAEPGCLFMSADYSQIELRLLADFSGDPIMIDAFAHGKDVHAITAAKIYHKELEEVTANERRNAKTANFGIAYGISPFGLSTRLGIPRAEAKEIIDNYFATFPGIRQYIQDSIESARNNGYVETRMGRRRMLPDISSRNPTVRGYAERNAVNAPLQGTAADIIKVAMVAICREIKDRGLKSKMIMQVHDELNFNVPAEEVAIMQDLVVRHMQSAYSGRVRLTTSCGVATNWLDAH